MPDKAKAKPKQVRNAAMRRAGILDAATREFSEKGFDGARVGTIAKLAKVNINLLYHYFDTKENLFIAVMEETYRTIRAHHNDATLRAADPAVAITRLIQSTFRLFTDNPQIIGLLNTENMHKACHVKQSDDIQALYNPLVEFIAETLDRGVAEGVFRTGVDPVELFISINAESYFHHSNVHTLSFILHQRLDDPARLKLRETQVTQMILAYLGAPITN